MIISNQKIWVIVSKDRKVIAKGTPRNRELIHLNDTKDKKRFLTYSSKGMAESAFKNNFFRQYGLGDVRKYTSDDLEAVEANMIISLI